MCVMRWGAFSVNTNPAGVAADHASSDAAVGMR